MKCIILGCGSSPGTPLIGCNCRVCFSSNPKNKRLRSSIYIETPKIRLLIDSSPDLRQQALANKILGLDAVLYTHLHADHVHGIDDLRSFNYLGDKVLPVFGTKEVLSEMQERFGYCFREPTKNWYSPCLVPNYIEHYQAFQLADLTITPFELKHGRFISTGFHIIKTLPPEFAVGPGIGLAYATDTNDFPERSLELIKNCGVFIIDCLSYQPNPAHAHLEKTLEWIGKVKPSRAILTHMNHGFDYDVLWDQLPQSTEPAYDGMVIECF